MRVIPICASLVRDSKVVPACKHQNLGFITFIHMYVIYRPKGISWDDRTLSHERRAVHLRCMGLEYPVPVLYKIGFRQR